jgi:superfamily I DNA/RNA helicase
LATHIDRTTRSKQLWGDNDLYKLVDALREHLEDKKEKWGTSAAKAGKLQDLRDTTEALLGAAEHMEDGTTIDQFKKWLFQRLGGVDLDNARQRKQFEKQMEEQNPVVLTTAHKSKGLEFDRVYIVGDNLFQHPKRRRPEDQAEGERLRYVAYTRAMRELHVLDTEKEPGEIGK